MTRSIPILPRHRMYLKVDQHECQLLDRGKRRLGRALAGHFRTVWRRLPLTVRRPLLRYWRTWPGRLRICVTRFRMEGLLACCADDGFTLRFLPFLDFDAPGRIQSVIAHELAHVYRHATLLINQLLDESVEQSEVATNEIAEGWGFPQKPFRRQAYTEDNKYVTTER